MRALCGIGPRGPANGPRIRCLPAEKATNGERRVSLFSGFLCRFLPSCRRTLWGWAGHEVAFQRWTAAGLLLSILIGACAGAPVHPAPPEGRFLFHSAAGPVAVVVTAMPPTMPGQIDGIWGEAAVLGVILVPLGVVAPPMAAGALVVGGGLLLALSATGYGIEGAGVTTVGRALQEASFPEVVADALRRRGSRLGSTGTAPVAHATVALEAWGVVSPTGTASGRHCFVARVILSVEREYHSAELARVEPLAQCASLGKFAAAGGRLVREVARDYAELLAVVIGERLEGLPCDSE